MSYFRLIMLCLGLSLDASGVLCAADGDIRTTGKFVSDAATGQPPLAVSSTTVVPNLNADMLDGYEATHFVVRPTYYGGYISIPLGSLILENSEVIADLGVKLPGTGFSSFSSNIVIPRDIAHPSNILQASITLEIMVYYPGPAGACQAVIEPLFAKRLRVPFEDGFYNVVIDAESFPPFVQNNTSIRHQYELSATPPDNPILFGVARHGDDPADNCGEVYVAGINITYLKDGDQYLPW